MDKIRERDRKILQTTRALLQFVYMYFNCRGFDQSEAAAKGHQ